MKNLTLLFVPIKKLKTHIFVTFLFTSSINLVAQKLCMDSQEIFMFTEVMPKCSPNLSTVEQLVNDKFSISDCGLENNDKIIVQYKINCKGEDFDYKIRSFNNKEINCELGDFLKTTLNWTPAKQRDLNVDFGGSLVLKIENSRYVILNNLKEEKKKRK